MIAILDYGSGNIRSAQRAIERVGAKTEVTSDYNIALSASGLFVPGVGAFGSCMNQLRAIRGDELIKERFNQDLPTLGVCVGMQVLFERSEESSELGIGLLSGEVKRLSSPILPHIGWNEVKAESPMRLMKGLDGARFYFVHSFATLKVSGDISKAIANYGQAFLAAIEYKTLSAVQFHPEKSGDAGLALLKNWVDSI